MNSSSGATGGCDKVGIASSSSAGNYKGVMLCNGPFGGFAVATKVPQSDGKVSFATGLVAQQVGVPMVGFNSRMRSTKRSKEDTVLTKHRKWLADLQRRKDTAELILVKEITAKEEAKQRFSAHEAKMRALIKQKLLLQGCKDLENVTKCIRADPVGMETQAEAKHEHMSYAYAEREKNFDVKSLEEALPLSPLASSVLPSSKSAGKETERAAEGMKLSAAIDKGDEDDLLNFADSLDFTKFIDDMEVHSMIRRLQRRIGELENEVKSEEARKTSQSSRGTDG
jgi:hypothetical protein